MLPRCGNNNWGDRVMTDAVPLETIAGIIRRHGTSRRGHIAVRCGNVTLTYGELDTRSNRVANALITAGLGRQARIAVLAGNCPEFFELWFGAVKANAVTVPVHLRYAAAAVAAIVNDAEAELLFVGAEFHALVETVERELPRLKAIIAIDGCHARWPAYADWMEAHSASDPQLPLAPDDCALQVYTDDSDVEPKGAQLSHAGLMQMFTVALAAFGEWHEGDVSIVCVPMFHLTGCGWAMHGLYCGAEIVLMRHFEAGECLRLLGRRRITKALFVAHMIVQMLQHLRDDEMDFPALELVVYGSTLTPRYVLDCALRTFGCDFAQVFGLPGITGPITSLSPQDHRSGEAEHLKSYGRPVADLELRIVDGADSELQPGQVGEVTCRAPRLMLGYWKHPEATARALRDGWFHTGHHGYVDPDGYLHIYESYWQTARSFWQV
jgi:long-chain acyl-CoA synthetase